MYDRIKKKRDAAKDALIGHQNICVIANHYEVITIDDKENLKTKFEGIIFCFFLLPEILGRLYQCILLSSYHLLF